MMRGLAGQESGDPAKAAAAMIRLSELESPPLRLLLGDDALAIARQSYRQSLADTDVWAHFSQSTGFNDDSSAGRAAALKSLGIS